MASSLLILGMAQPHALPSAVGRDEHDACIFQRSHDGLHGWTTRDAMAFFKVEQRLEMDPGRDGKVTLRHSKQAAGTTALPGRNPVF